LFANPSLVAAFAGSFILQMLVLYVTPVGHFFQIVPVGVQDLAIVVALSLSPVAATETIKIFMRARKQQDFRSGQ
jgi:magnesium-transporting ATPase (P-type)